MLLAVQEFMIIDFRDRIIMRQYNTHPIYHFISIPLQFQRKHINGFIKTIKLIANIQLVFTSQSARFSIQYRINNLMIKKRLAFPII